MLTVNLGPFALSIYQLVLLLSLLLALGVGKWVGRRRQGNGIGQALTDMLLAALLVARVVFVVTWFDTYRRAPWSMLDIRDGGFTTWTGVVAALLVALWHGWRRPALRRALGLGLVAGALAWGAMYGALRLLERPDVPDVPLATLAGEPVALATVAGGKPMVVNLWATWCPPCRREMPVLAAAQQQETGVRFVFVDQGEDGSSIQRYLLKGQLDLTNVLLDPGARLGREVGSMGLPTTLFYDAQGKMVDAQVGGLSSASLASKLNRLRPSAENATPK